MQAVDDPTVILVGAREAPTSWLRVGTVELPLDDGFSPRGHSRYGDITIDVPRADASVRAACSNGIAVPDPGFNAGLVGDFVTLLEAHDVLVGDDGAPLPSWTVDRPVADWTGVAVDGEPPRVTEITLSEVLHGRVPPGLARLERLRTLQLYDTPLTGEIPRERGRFSGTEPRDRPARGGWRPHAGGGWTTKPHPREGDLQGQALGIMHGRRSFELGERIGRGYEVSPSGQERRCVDAICQYLKQTTGDVWRIESWLDDRYHAEPSPDVLLSDGEDDIAIEIKQLTDGESFRTYDQAQQSLYRRLAPDTTRNYTLFPPPSIRLPLDPLLVKQLKAQIAIAATELRVGGSVEVPIRRRATVRFLRQCDEGFVCCLHERSDDVRAVSLEVTGIYLLEDGGEPDHQFLSEECRSAFHRALRRACKDSNRDGRADVEWCEQWELQRGKDLVEGEGEGGVLAIAAVVDFLESAAIESIDQAIRRAIKKFKAKKWARHSAVALHAGEQQHELSPAFFESAITRLEAADIQPLDSVFLVKGADVRQFNFAR